MLFRSGVGSAKLADPLLTPPQMVAGIAPMRAQPVFVYTSVTAPGTAASRHFVVAMDIPAQPASIGAILNLGTQEVFTEGSARAHSSQRYPTGPYELLLSARLKIWGAKSATARRKPVMPLARPGVM